MRSGARQVIDQIVNTTVSTDTGIARCAPGRATAATDGSDGDGCLFGAPALPACRVAGIALNRRFHEGISCSNAGIAAAHTSAAARIQCRSAADRPRSSAVAASAASTMPDILIEL